MGAGHAGGKDTAVGLFADQQALDDPEAGVCGDRGGREGHNRGSRGRRRRYVIVDLVRRRPLDNTEGRSKKVLRA